MSLVKKAGLAGAGGAGRMSLARMPVLLRHMGPVKSSSFRVARRLASSLRYGHAVRDYAEFGACHSIWIVGSDSWIEAAAAELAAAIPLRGKTVILSDAWCDSHASSALRAAGAHTASLNAVEETDHRIFVGEGHPAALPPRKPCILPECSSERTWCYRGSPAPWRPFALPDSRAGTLRWWRKHWGLARCAVTAKGAGAPGTPRKSPSFIAPSIATWTRCAPAVAISPSFMKAASREPALSSRRNRPSRRLS